jgi:LacI family gluconate utilization system Gnt-I transcriptional repressor
MLELSDVRVVEMMDIDSEPIDIAVGMSHCAAGKETARYLLTRGYRRFGYIGHNWDQDYRARLRHLGLTKALAESGLSITAEAITPGASSVGAGRAMTAQLLASTPSVQAIVYSNDDMAVGGVFHIMGTGLSIPNDIAVFGFNGLDIGQEMPQPLSTIRSNRFMIGKRAIDAVLEDPQRPDHHTTIDTGFEIVTGATA